MAQLHWNTHPDGRDVDSAGERLRKSLPNDWDVFFGGLVDDGSRGRQLDFVLLGRHLLTVLEAKHWRFEGFGRGRGPTIEQAKSQAYEQAQTLGSYLRTALAQEPGGRSVFVDYRVLMTHGSAGDATAADPRLLGLDDLSKLKLWDQELAMQRDGEAVRRCREGILAALLALRSSVPEDSGGSDLELLNRAEREHHRSRFVGRSDLLEEILKALRREPGSYLLLEGPPGAGKSALCAELVERCPQDWKAVLHFARAESEPDKFLPLMTAELFRLAGLGPSPARAAHLKSALVTVASSANLVRTPLVLILDGLDEIHDSNLDFLPVSLPENVRVVCTGRPGAPQVERVRHRLRNLTLMWVPRLAPGEERSLLERRLGGGGLGRLERLHSWHEAVRMADGSPLVLHSLVERLGSLGGTWSDLPDRAGSSPFESVIEALAPVGSLERDLLDLLAVARGPLAAEQLENVLLTANLNVEFRTVQSALGRLAPVLIHDDGRGTGRIFHLSLVDLLHARLGTSGVRRLHGRLANWCIAEREADEYARENLVSHLLAAGEHQLARQFLLDAEVLEYRCRARQVRLLLKDLQELIQTQRGAAAIPENPEVTRYRRELADWAQQRRSSKGDGSEGFRDLPTPPNSRATIGRLTRKAGKPTRDRAELRSLVELHEFLSRNAAVLEEMPDAFLPLAASEPEMGIGKAAEELLRRSDRTWFRHVAGGPDQRGCRSVGRHSADIRGLTATPDFGMAVSCSQDGVLRLWDIPGGGLLAEAHLAQAGPQPENGYTDFLLRISVDGRDLLVVDKFQKEVQHWTWLRASGLRFQRTVASASITDVVFLSPDGSEAVTWDPERGLLLSSLWDEAAPQELERLPTWAGVRFAPPDQRLLLFLEELHLRTGSGRSHELKLEHFGSVAAASADLKLVAVLNPQETFVQLVDMERKKSLGYLLHGLPMLAPGLELSPDGSEILFASGPDLLVRSIDTVESQAPHERERPRLCSDGALGWLAMLASDRILVRNLRDGRRALPNIRIDPTADLTDVFSFREQVLALLPEPWLVFSDGEGPDWTQFKISDVAWLRAVNLHSGQESAPSRPMKGLSGALGVRAAAFEVLCSTAHETFWWNWRQNLTREATATALEWVSPDATIGIAREAEGGSSLVVWDLESGLPAGRFSAHEARVQHLVFTRSGRAMSLDETGRLLEWQARSGEIQSCLRLPHPLPTEFRAIPGSRVFVAGSLHHGTLQVWHLDTGDCVARVPLSGGTWFLSEITEDGCFAIHTWTDLMFFRVEGFRDSQEVNQLEN